MSEKILHHEVAIVGAGFGGLGMAMALKQQLGFEDFIIIERDGGVGGTWWANTYPGAASDYPIHGYCLSTDLKADWDKTHGSQKEIQSYISDLATKHDLLKHCVFDTSVDSATWDAQSNVWRVQARHVKSGERTAITAKVVVSAVGLLCQPNVVDIPGANTFKGAMFHSARWDHSVDLRGKRVAVIGNGCSSAQIVPSLTRDPSIDVVNFCRTRMWYLPAEHTPYSPMAKWTFAHVPLAMRLYRWWIQARHDLNFIGFRERNFGLSESLKKQLTNFIKTTAPAEYHDLLVPNYSPGCKRLIIDNGFLSSLSRPNMHMNWDGIERVTEDGISTKTGEHLKFDAIVYATGFISDKYPFEVYGRSGATISEYYKSNEGPIGYLSTTAPQFPNFITILGPNSATGHFSAVFAQEVQFNYAIQLVKPVLSGALSTFEVTARATDKYNSWLKRRLDTSVWTHCASWYRKGSNGKVFTNFPGPMALFWWIARSPRWDDYATEGPGKAAWERKRVARGAVSWLLLGCSAVLLCEWLRVFSVY